MLIAITFGIILVAIALAKLGTFTRSFWIADDATSARLAAVDAEISGRA